MRRFLQSPDLVSPTTAGISATTAVFFAAITAAAPIPEDPFAFLSPDVVVSRVERERLDRGETVVRVLPGRDGFLSLSALIRVDANGDRLTAWARRVEALQKGKYVPEIGRFSSVPRLDDLDGLTLDAEDLDEMRQCRPGDCGVKLSAAEMGLLRGTRDRAELALVFRRALVQRATDYLERGDVSAAPYHDHKTPVEPAEIFTELLKRLEFFRRHLAYYADYLHQYPAGRDQHMTDSFLYWSKETLGMKPIISITHFSVARFDTAGVPDAVVVAKQVYATHYKDAAVTMTAIAGSGSNRYLVYVNRARVDAFQGFFGGVVRRVVERRVKAEAPAILVGLRKRLESGEPNGTSVAH